MQPGYEANCVCTTLKAHSNGSHYKNMFLNSSALFQH